MNEQRLVPCNECNGEGGFDGVDGGVCSECGGTGKTEQEPLPKYPRSAFGLSHSEGENYTSYELAQERINALEAELAELRATDHTVQMEETVDATAMRNKYEALEKENAALKAKVDGIRGAYDKASESLHDLGLENADLKAKVERIRHPMVYEGATFYTQAAVPDICPDCDGRNFVSHGVRGMVCWTCCLMRDLEAVQAQVADGDLAFNHANEVVGKLEAQVARLSALVSDEEPDTCEGCEKPLREDEGHETEDMVMLCDECWQGMLDDPDCHSEECQCALCIASRTTPAKEHV